MSLIWAKFPEINRKVAFTYNYVSPHLPLGCHCGSLSGITANFGTGYYAANEGRNIEVLDLKQEAKLEYERDAYSHMLSPPKEEVTKVLNYLKDKKISFQDIMQKGVYESIAESCSCLPLWVMSDVINYSAPARKSKTHPFGAGGSTLVYEVFGHTSDFAQYLIDKKIGYVMESPIIQNPLHRSPGNYSLNRGWLWIPPNHMERAINVGGTHGDEKFPPKKEWLKKVGADLKIPITNDYEQKVLAQVFNDGAYPTNEDKEEKEFGEAVNLILESSSPKKKPKKVVQQRKRGKNGQFLPQPYIRAA